MKCDHSEGWCVNLINQKTAVRKLFKLELNKKNFQIGHVEVSIITFKFQQFSVSQFFVFKIVTKVDGN